MITIGDDDAKPIINRSSNSIRQFECGSLPILNHTKNIRKSSDLNFSNYITAKSEIFGTALVFFDFFEKPQLEIANAPKEIRKIPREKLMKM